MRERLVENGLWTLLAVAVGTEALSLLGAIHFWPVAVLWMAIAACWVLRLRGVKTEFRWELWVWTPVWALEGVAALGSPPNSNDALAYHYPRIVYWLEQGSVENFATPYLNQIMLQPLMEYVAMHLDLLSGGDRFANCVAWLSTAGYVVAASLVAKELGAGSRGQGMAALAAATLPNGILQASGMKNEALLSFLVMAAVYFALRWRKWMLGLAVGLACFTKGTAYLFLGPMLPLPQVALVTAVVNGPFYWRNLDLSGSPLGFDSAQGDGVYVWRNEPLSARSAWSNFVRHLSEQLGGRSEASNRAVYEAALWLGADVYARENTWAHEKFAPPKNANHEADANNRWHLLLALLALGYVLWKREWRVLAIYGGIAFGVAGVCGYLKWQPFMARMWLPLFVVACVPVGLWLGRCRGFVQVLVALWLLNGARRPLLDNWLRPLRGEKSIFARSREELTYADLAQFGVEKEYRESLQVVGDCRFIGIDANRFSLEYPLMAKYRDRRFLHVNVTNASRKYAQEESPCVTVCLACRR